MAHANGCKSTPQSDPVRMELAANLAQGIVLILCAIRSMLWYRFQGQGHYIIHGFQISAGVFLGLLGLLNIGGKHGEYATIEEEESVSQLFKTINPMYRLVILGAPLVVVMGVYLVTFLGSTLVMTWVHWRKGGIYQDDDDDEEEVRAHGYGHGSVGTTAGTGTDIGTGTGSGIEGTRLHHE